MSGKADYHKGAKASSAKKQPAVQVVKKGQSVSEKTPASQKAGGKPTKKKEEDDPAPAGTGQPVSEKTPTSQKAGGKPTKKKEEDDTAPAGTGQPVSEKTPASQKAGGKPTKKKEEDDTAPAGTELEDRAAQTIQCAFRQSLARKQRAKLHEEKQAYEELMDRLQKEAFVMMVKKEQEAAEMQRKKEEEERKKKQEAVLRKKRILEAAFEGDMDEIFTVLKEVSDMDTKNGIGFDERGKAVRFQNQINMVDCTDANGNTPLSEAAGGGNPEVIKLLIERGAQPNSKGAFGRTPLYRAAFGAHLTALQMLLQYGADPRIYADDGSTPEQVASLDSVSKVLHSWDTALTDSMLQKMEAEQLRRRLEEKRMKDADTDRMRNEVSKLTTEHERCQKELQQAYCELNKRIMEHDKCVIKHSDKTKLTLQAIHDAEATVDLARLAAMKAEEQLSLARLRLREQTESGSDSGLPGLKCTVQELDEVLLKDIGDKIRLDGRWPLIIDSSGQAAIFLRYRDTNYLNTLDPADMQEETLRMALLGALRYGKPLVFDMMEVNMFDAVKRQLEQIKTGLMDELLSKSILQNDRFLTLLQATDGPEYSRTQFQRSRIENFKLFFITKQQQPPELLLSLLCPIEVLLSRPSI